MYAMVAEPQTQSHPARACGGGVVCCSDRRAGSDRREDLSENLLQRVASGDEGAVRQCIDRFGGLVWSLARRMLATEAEDAVQEIFVELWRCADRYDPKIASEATFVAMLARRRLVDRKRRHGRLPSEASFDERIVGGGPESTARTATPSEIGDEVGRVREAFGSLSEDQQRVLTLSIDRGLSHHQISQSTGLPLGTVKTHARRGLIKLREMLAEQNQTGVGR